MKTTLLQLALALLAFAAAILAGGGLGRLRARRQLIPAAVMVILLALAAGMTAQELVSPMETVTLLAYNTRNENAPDTSLTVDAVGCGALEREPEGEMTGSWRREGRAFIWESTQEGQLEEPDILTLQVPAGASRWIRFAAGHGQVLIADRDGVVQADTFLQAAAMLSPSPPETLQALKTRRLKVYALLMLPGAAMLIFWLRRPRERVSGLIWIAAMALITLGAYAGFNKRGVMGAAFLCVALGAGLKRAAKAPVRPRRLWVCAVCCLAFWELACLMTLLRRGDISGSIGNAWPDLLLLRSLFPGQAVLPMSRLVSALALSAPAILLADHCMPRRWTDTAAPLAALVFVGYGARFDWALNAGAWDYSFFGLGSVGLWMVFGLMCMGWLAEAYGDRLRQLLPLPGFWLQRALGLWILLLTAFRGERSMQFLTLLMFLLMLVLPAGTEGRHDHA